MKVYLAADHAGFELKEKIKEFLNKEGYQIEDFGAYQFNPDDDYPDFITKAGEAVSQNPQDKAIILGGSGQGEAAVANKSKGVRASLFYAPAAPSQAVDITGRMSDDPFEMVRLSREHDNANVLSLAARFLKEEDALKAVKLFLETPFPADERHSRRLKKIEEIENL